MHSSALPWLQKATIYLPLNGNTGRKTQLTWTVLPQGFQNSPTTIRNQLAKELETWERPPGNGILLQYVDDILITTEKDEKCKERTVSLLNFLGLSGYRVSLQKAQILKKEVIYLGFVISTGQRQLGNDRKEAICRTPGPTMVKEPRTFLGNDRLVLMMVARNRNGS